MEGADKFDSNIFSAMKKIRRVELFPKCGHGGDDGLNTFSVQNDLDHNNAQQGRHIKFDEHSMIIQEVPTGPSVNGDDNTTSNSSWYFAENYAVK